MKNIFLFFLLLVSECLFAQTSIIKGVAPEYAGMEIPVYSYSDFISEEKMELGKMKFQADGSFSVKINLPYTTVCFTEFDIYQAMIYVEPGKTYEIQFPPRQKQTDAQKRNPFFKLLPVYFKIINQADDDLNLMIKNYEEEFHISENKYFYDIYDKHSRESLELVKTELSQKFPKTENRYFEDYKKYRIGNLEYALSQGKSKEFVNSYFGKVSPKMQLPAYTNLFDQLFTNYFSFLGNSANDQKIATLINSGDVKALEKYLSVQNGWNTDVCCLIILKSLKDAFYSGQFSKVSVIKAYKQVDLTDWNEAYKRIAKNILEKITYLSVGTQAPPVQFVRANGQKLSLAEYKGRYVYLHFTDLKNPVCRQHMDALKNLADQCKNNLVVIFVTEGKTDEAEMRKWTGVFVTASDDVKNAYRVKTFPTSYLIDRSGKLLSSPALNPMNGFENQFRKILEKERIDKLRGN